MKKRLLELLSKLKTFALKLFAGAKNIVKNHKLYSILAIVFVVLVVYLLGMSKRITSLKNERYKYKSNTEALLAQTKTYKTKDSLNAASAYEIQLKFAEYKKAHPKDAKVISTLQIKGRSLQSVLSVEGKTKVPLSIPLKDSVISTKDTISAKNGIHSVNKSTIYVKKDTVQTIKSYTEWYSIDGYIDGYFKGDIGFNESLNIVVTVKYKRFLGFLWHTNKVKNRKIDVVSLNPYSKITKVEYTTITK